MSYSYIEDKAGYIAVLGLVVPAVVVMSIVPAGTVFVGDIGPVGSNLVGEVLRTVVEVAHIPGLEVGPCIAAAGWIALGVVGVLPPTVLPLLPPFADSSCYE